MDTERFYCQACKGAFDRKQKIPRILNQCRHDVCQECLVQILSTNTLENMIRCPICFSKNVVDPRNKKNHHFFKRNQALLSSSFFTASENEIKKCLDHPEHLADLLCVHAECRKRRLVCLQCKAEGHRGCEAAGGVKRLSEFNQSIVVDPVSLDIVSFTNEVYKTITKELLALGSKLRSVVFAVGKALQDEMNVVNKITMASLNHQADKIQLTFDPASNTVTASHRFEKQIVAIYHALSAAFMGKQNVVWHSLEDHVNRLVALHTLPLARLSRQHAEFVDRVEALLEASLPDPGRAALNFPPDDYMNLKVYHGKVFSVVEKAAADRLAQANYSMQDDYNSMLNVSARADRTFYQDEPAPDRPDAQPGLNRSFLKSFVEDTKASNGPRPGPPPSQENSMLRPGSVFDVGGAGLPLAAGHITAFKNWAANESVALTEDRRRLVFKKATEQFDHSTLLPCAVYKFPAGETTRFRIRVNSAFEDLKSASLEQTANVLSPNGVQWLQFSLATPDAVENLRGTRLVEKFPGGPGRFRFVNLESSASLPALGKMSGMSRLTMFSPTAAYLCEFVPGSHFLVFPEDAGGPVTGLRLRRGQDYYLCLRFLYKDNACALEELA